MLIKIQERIEFQSHIGAIRILYFSTHFGFSSCNFNPTLVQLEFSSWHSAVPKPRAFQSHIGAIRIVLCPTKWCSCSGFQSHIGAIRMRRRNINQVISSKFQSHIGAIRMKFKSKGAYKEPKISIPHWCN